MIKVEKEHSSVSCLKIQPVVVVFFFSALCAAKYALLPQTKFVLIYFLSLQYSHKWKSS